MISLQEYQKNPCGTLSLPYWKAKNISLPKDMVIVHDTAFCEDEWSEYIDEKYFRLYHHMKEVQSVSLSCYEIVTATDRDIEDIVELINRSYTDIQVSRDQMTGYRNTSACMPALWILVKEKTMKKLVGCGIADYDREAREVILEWIQVLPEYRRQGIGQAIVMELLHRAKDQAVFSTVSGRVDNETRPELLYRKCGFEGNDIRHILRRKNRA